MNVTRARRAAIRRPWTPAILIVLWLPLAAAAEVTDTAVYRLRFRSDWSAATHPESFPRNPHFSPLIGGVHNAGVRFWREGGLASRGIEVVAEQGRTSPFDQQLANAVADGTALTVLRGGGIDRSPGAVALTFTVEREFPLVTLVSMLAPSPDWFVGVAGLSLFEDGDWVEEKVATLYALDAGTDSGATYTAANDDTVPPEPIHRIVSGPLGNGAPVGTFTFTRQDVPESDALVLGGGRFRVSARWRDFDLVRGRGRPIALTEDTGFFWFFGMENVEVVVKVLDGCGFNQRYWVFAGGLTNVEVELTVEDTETGQVSGYFNPLGQAFQPIQDTDAFAICP